MLSVDAASIAPDVREAVAAVAPLPVPGRGDTSERHRRLAALARHRSVSVARLVEAHVDALAILAEAGRDPHPGALYGVWAARAGGTDAQLDLDRRWVTGTKVFCSGLGIADRALVTADDRAGRQHLVELDLHRPSVRVHRDRWSTPALAATCTGSVELDQPVDAIVGAPGWYLRRPGFWHGACGPAACWAGAAVGLVDAAERLVDDDPHRRAHVGAMRAASWGLDALLDRAGSQIDAAPDDVLAAERRARALRHLVERMATEVLDRFGRAFGPRPLTTDAAIAQRAADLHLYLRQDHGERDLAALGAMAEGVPPSWRGEKVVSCPPRGTSP